MASSIHGWGFRNCNLLCTQLSKSNSAAVFLACNQDTILEFEVEKGAYWFSFS